MFGLAVGASLALPAAAHAYIDPGTGSFVLQLVLGALFAGGVAIKMSWRRVKGQVSTMLSRFRTAGGQE